MDATDFSPSLVLVALVVIVVLVVLAVLAFRRR